jgi:hypothetical protein
MISGPLLALYPVLGYGDSPFRHKLVLPWSTGRTSCIGGTGGTKWRTSRGCRCGAPMLHTKPSRCGLPIQKTRSIPYASRHYHLDTQQLGYQEAGPAWMVSPAAENVDVLHDVFGASSKCNRGLLFNLPILKWIARHGFNSIELRLKTL